MNVKIISNQYQIYFVVLFFWRAFVNLSCIHPFFTIIFWQRTHFFVCLCILAGQSNTLPHLDAQPFPCLPLTCWCKLDEVFVVWLHWVHLWTWPWWMTECCIIPWFVGKHFLQCMQGIKPLLCMEPSVHSWVHEETEMIWYSTHKHVGPLHDLFHACTLMKTIDNSFCNICKCI